MCFVNWSSVINLDLFWKQVFSYKSFADQMSLYLPNMSISQLLFDQLAFALTPFDQQTFILAATTSIWQHIHGIKSTSLSCHHMALVCVSQLLFDQMSFGLTPIDWQTLICVHIFDNIAMVTRQQGCHRIDQICLLTDCYLTKCHLV